MLPMVCFAQFKASHLGVVTENGDKDYHVVEFDGKTANELYEGVLKWVNENFKNPDIVANSIENSMINIHAFYNDAYLYSNQGLGFKYYAKVDVNYIIKFKDGKIRFDCPVVNEMYIRDNGKNLPITFSGNKQFMYVVRNLFSEDGKPQKNKQIERFNIFINEYVNSICDYINSPKTDDNW